MEYHLLGKVMIVIDLAYVQLLLLLETKASNVHQFPVLPVMIPLANHSARLKLSVIVWISQARMLGSPTVSVMRSCAIYRALGLVKPPAERRDKSRSYARPSSIFTTKDREPVHLGISELVGVYTQ
jgi:hypothetical protein